MSFNRRAFLAAMAAFLSGNAFCQQKPPVDPNSDTPWPTGPDGKPLLDTKPPEELKTTNWRGEVVSLGSPLILKTREGRELRLELGQDVPVFVLSASSYAKVDFGTYVGAVSRKLGDNIYSPIVRDSLSWLHRAFELRIIDDKLRGIAVGHTKWDLAKDSVMTHGWVDDMEGRVISIKYGPTEMEETDVEVTRETPVTFMALGDRSLIKPGARVFAGGSSAGGKQVPEFIFVGKDQAVPSL
ncbi:MAG TPA: hypothetical protein VD965_08185 [Burkholderiales bacterium]|nr:hypothetical protein [Burkholderiales bacterium]